MANSSYVFDATVDNFHKLVLENSENGPVLVNYWSPRAGPCMMLMPRLVRLATEFAGRFLLVMLNTDELGRLAREHGVNSLPTVKIFQHGKVLETLHGAELETVLRDFISKHISNEADGKYASALQAYQRGDLDKAVAQAAEAALAEPENPRLATDLVKLLVLQKRYSRANELLKSLPMEVRNHPEMHELSMHISLICTAQEAPPVTTLERVIAEYPGNLEARYQLCAVKMTQDDFEAAMNQFLEIARRDNTFRHQAGREGLLAIFRLLGEDDERVQRYRALLNLAMH